MLSPLFKLFLRIVPIDSAYQIARFLVVGVVSAVLEIGILVLLVEYFQWRYLAANILAFLITNVVNYLLSRTWVFTSDHNKKLSEFMIFMAFVSIGLCINQLFLWLLVEYLDLNYKVAKVVAIVITIIWNFLTRKHLVFKTKMQNNLESI